MYFHAGTELAKIAIVGTPAFGHVIPILGPIAELVRRGHEVVVYNSIEFEKLITSTGASFVAFSSTLAKDFSRELKEGSH